MQKKKRTNSYRYCNLLRTSRIINVLFSSKNFNSVSAAANKKLRNFKKPYLKRTTDGSKCDVIRSIIDLYYVNKTRNKKKS